MDDFMQKLLALRSKVGGVAKGTLQNMGNVREREQEMLDAERARNEDLMTRGFGSPQNYMDMQNATSTPQLPQTPGGSIGDFFARILGARDNAGKMGKKQSTTKVLKNN